MNASPFTLSLYKLVSSQQGGNFFMSPKNMLDAITMLYLAARNKTAQEIRESCGFPQDLNELLEAVGTLNKTLAEIEDCALKTANGVWVHHDFKFNPEYVKTVREECGAELRSVDYRDLSKHDEIVADVNSWTSEKTEGKIPTIIEKDFINKDSVMVLISAIYFFGNWMEKFKEAYTKDDAFFVQPNETKQVKMMNRTGEIFYRENDLCQMVDLPYVGEDLSMTVILPKKKDGLKQVEQSLEAISNADFVQEQVILSMPKWKQETTLKLNELWQELGINEAFTDNADFRNMIQEGTPEWEVGVKINKAIHKAYVDVSEEGTEAAAATAVDFVRCCSSPMPVEPKVFKADHPFVYMIRHRSSNNVLFIGRVANP